MSLDPNSLQNFLRHCVLFEEADDAALAAITQRLELVKFRQGDPVVLENEISDHVYFVYSGSVEVVKHIRELNQLSRVAVLKAGSQFSEFSVINRSNKGASVFALEDCELLRMSGPKFLEVLREHPKVTKHLIRHVAGMTRHLQTSNLRIDYVDPDKIALHPHVPQILPVKMWRKFEALPLRHENSSLLVAMKDPQNAAFFEFMKNSQPKVLVYVTVISDADFDVLEKELTTAYSQPHIPSPQHSTPATPLQGPLKSWLKKISLFSELPAEWIDQLEPYFSFQSFSTGDIIYKSGVVSDKLYILQSGQVDVFLPLNSTNAAAHIGTIPAGEYFSEISLLTQNPHILSARASTPVTVATLSKEVFEKFLDVSNFTLPLARDLVIQFQSISNKMGFRFFDPKEGVQVLELASLIPKSIIDQYGILPLRLKDKELTIGITNPESDTIYSVISRYLQDYRVNLEIIKPQDFRKWLKEIEARGKESTAATTTIGRQESANLVTGNAVAILNKILNEGFENRSSDIHFEPSGECFVVRYRIDGVLREHSEKYSKQLGAEIINRIKILSHMDVTNKFIPQDGQLKLELNGQTAYARASTLPCKHGETVVMRLIRERNSVPPLSVLAPDRRVVNLLREVTETKQGVFLVTGPTGSGKSTTLYSLLKELNRVERSIISLEDPVEMEIPGTTQVEINEKVGLTFAAGLRSALRQDPNVIMIGEIRDEESAKIAFHAASTGHLVISTLHTNDSLNIIPRLVELGVSRGHLASTLIGASAQRLVRQMCGKCREMHPITKHELDLLKKEVQLDFEPSELPKAKGCSHCDHTGYHGRLPVFEIWQKSKPLENLILSSASLEAIEQELRKVGYVTLREFALRMVVNGLTTLEEVRRSLGGWTTLDADAPAMTDSNHKSAA